jgi:MFS family permease
VALRRSVLVLGIVLSSAAMWAVVLAWPGHAPLAVLVLLVVVLAANGPGSMVGFDFARTENPPARLGSASGIVNVGGFVSSLLMILVIGLLLDASGSYRVGMSAQYAFWAVGLAGVLVTRRTVRRRKNIVVDAFPRGGPTAGGPRSEWPGRRLAAGRSWVAGSALVAPLPIGRVPG